MSRKKVDRNGSRLTKTFRAKNAALALVEAELEQRNGPRKAWESKDSMGTVINDCLIAQLGGKFPEVLKRFEKTVFA